MFFHGEKQLARCHDSQLAGHQASQQDGQPVNMTSSLLAPLKSWWAFSQTACKPTYNLACETSHQHVSKPSGQLAILQSRIQYVLPA
jgi:hypothetical protein